MAPIRKFHDQAAARPEDSSDFSKGRLGIAEVDEQANRDHGVDRGILHRQMGGVAEDDRAARVGANSLASRLDHDRGGIHEADGLEPAVLIDEPTEAGAEVNEMATRARQEGPQRDSIATVFVRADRPEGIAVGQVVRWRSWIPEAKRFARGRLAGQSCRRHVPRIPRQPE